MTDPQEKRMSGLEKAVADLAQNQKRAQADATAQAYRKHLIEILTTTFDRGAAYTQILLIAVYAGCFTLFSFTASVLTVRTTQIVGLLLVISLASFGAHEVYKMVRGVRDGLKQQALILKHGSEPEKFMTAYKEYQDQVRANIAVWPIRIWVVSLVVSFSTAASALMVLASALLAGLLGIAWKV